MKKKLQTKERRSIIFLYSKITKLAMGIKERRNKEKIQRKELILNTAMNLIHSEGVHALTMRKLAERIEYSPCVLYETFPNKKALLLELFSKVCEELFCVMNAVSSNDDPEIYFKKLIKSDVEFMTQKPFRVELFTIVSNETSPQNFPLAMQEIVDLIGNSLKLLKFPKLKTKNEIVDAQEVLRTFLTGLLNLFIAQRSKESLARCKRILNNGLDILLQGWKN